MNTLKLVKANGWFEQLPKSSQLIIKEAILKAAADRNGPEGFKYDKEAIDDIECHSRDGFIASSYNKGGFVYRNFCTLEDYYSGGYIPAHIEAAKEIESLIDQNLVEEDEECLGGENNTVMHELRFMYHGYANGEHSASISAALNTEAPYHRPSISWAPNVFCEGSKEVVITWKSSVELKQKLTKAFKLVSKSVF